MTKELIFLLPDFPRCCPLILNQLGVHRYELVINGKQADRITSTTPRYVKVPNRAVDMDSRARPACYPRGSFYPLSPVRHHDGSEDH